MSERETLRMKRWACVKRGFIMIPISTVAVLLLWAWIQPTIFPLGWAPPDIAYRFAPSLSFKQDIDVGSAIYTTVLVLISIWPFLEISFWWSISSRLWDAEAASSKRRLEDES